MESLTTAMETSTPTASSTIQSDFGPSWSNNLNTTIPSTELAIIENEAWRDQVHRRDTQPTEPVAVDLNPASPIRSSPELAIVEHKAWKDQVHIREYAPTTPTPLDAPGLWRKSRQAQMAKQKMMTPPPTPRRYEREYDESSGEEEETENEDEDGSNEDEDGSNEDEDGSNEDEDGSNDDEDGSNDDYRLQKERWAVINYEEYYNKLKQAQMDDEQVRNNAKTIMFYVFLAVLLHGIWIHRNESQKSDNCQCDCGQRQGLGNATGTFSNVTSTFTATSTLNVTSTFTVTSTLTETTTLTATSTPGNATSTLTSILGNTTSTPGNVEGTLRDASGTFSSATGT
jgi:hypothetical protein